MRPVALYDACVLYPSTLRDVLIRVGMAGLVSARWTDEILDEVFRNLAEDRPDLEPERLRRTRELMEAAIRDVQVSGYEGLVDGLTLPDPDDRHVLAAAIEAGANVIVTKNLKDFPAAVLSEHDIEAQHPDAFLLDVHWQRPGALPRIIGEIAATRRSGGTDDVIKALAVETPSAAAAIGAAIAA